MYKYVLILNPKISHKIQKIKYVYELHPKLIRVFNILSNGHIKLLMKGKNNSHCPIQVSFYEDIYKQQSFYDVNQISENIFNIKSIKKCIIITNLLNINISNVNTKIINRYIIFYGNRWNTISPGFFNYMCKYINIVLHIRKVRSLLQLHFNRIDVLAKICYNSQYNHQECEGDKIVIYRSKFQTKKWRKLQGWYHNGKHNECEIYQRNIIEKITNRKCIKTNIRLNLEIFKMRKLSYPLVRKDGFEWTEDFDGIQIIHGYTLYYNMKMICDKGGAQTRSLREVYHFIKTQYNYLLQNDKERVYFINILDGDESYRHFTKFKYLTHKKRYANIRDSIFVGDLYHFYIWFFIHFVI